MLNQLLWALLLTAITVVMHSCYSALTIKQIAKAARPREGRYLHFFLVRVVIELMLVHSAETIVWAWFYEWKNAEWTWNTALYFSVVSYATLGYGDVLLPPEWRLVGALQSLVGVLLAGWSVALLVAVLQSTLRKKVAEERLPLRRE
ncbi:two pore domain potassium channel family protein [Lysobacter arenosi]|uniref:Two pore domain potassium channel family protein n=1 Tax=Lysobacter arenosi TaxID=2795387 RepID=A0ABX7RC74_9GAMM|nr:potassium channel family protein [Lysobacter arenosi]QSX75758.1 two pore domain potassium channel family protein [Lysobacter arenosi]